jgi:hypothetical protein
MSDRPTFTTSFETEIEPDAPVPVPEPAPVPAPHPEPAPPPVVEPPKPGVKPRLTEAGRKHLRERYLLALELDPPGHIKLTPAQKEAYTKWLDFHMGE